MQNISTVSATEAAAVLGLAVSTVILNASRGDLPAVRVGGKFRIPSAYLADIITGNRKD